MYDSIYRSDDGKAKATVSRHLQYTIEYYEDGKLVDSAVSYNRDSAESLAEDYILERN